MPPLSRVSSLFVAIAILMTAYVHAATPAPINIWPGTPPGTENWTDTEHTYPKTPVGTVIVNVVTPTLTPFLPSQSHATRTAVVVAPGGACAAIAIEREGYDLARWLQRRGIAAFVLKYRVPEKKQEGIPNTDPDIACKYGSDDAIQAVKLVRERAKQWSIDPNKIGIVGFSAGGQVATGTLLQPSLADRPNFAAFIYGAPFGKTPDIPGKVPPVFMAWAQDDPIALDSVTKFYDALRAAGNKPEAHVFDSGGHGFGMHAQGTSSDRWVDEFYYWLEAHHLAKR